MSTRMPCPTARSAVPMAAVVFPLPGPVFTMMRPRRRSDMRAESLDYMRAGIPVPDAQITRRTVLVSVRLYSRGVDPLRHFDDSLQLRVTFTVRGARILGTQQAGCDPQSVHLFADPQQFLLFHS